MRNTIDRAKMSAYSSGILPCKTTKIISEYISEKKNYSKPLQDKRIKKKTKTDILGNTLICFLAGN